MRRKRWIVYGRLIQSWEKSGLVVVGVVTMIVAGMVLVAVIAVMAVDRNHHQS